MEESKKLYAIFFVEDLVRYMFSTRNITWIPFRPDHAVDKYRNTPDFLKFNFGFARAAEVASLVFHRLCNTECKKIWSAVENAPESEKSRILFYSLKSCSDQLGSSSCNSVIFLVIAVDICRGLYLDNDLHSLQEVIFIAADYLTRLVPVDDPRGMFSAMNHFASNLLETYNHQNILDISTQEFLRENIWAAKMDENIG